jgi:hypothetical protein
MVKSRAEMMERVGRLLAEYAEFQRGPICPTAICWTCRKKNGDPRRRISARQWRPKQTTLIRRRRGLFSEHRPAPVTDLGCYSPGKRRAKRKQGLSA